MQVKFYFIILIVNSLRFNKMYIFNYINSVYLFKC
jgi:hypothetical protein